MELSHIFTKTNIEILKAILKEPSYIREIAAKIKCSPAKVHSAVNIFKRFNIINESNNKNKRVITLNLENDLTNKIIPLIKGGAELGKIKNEKINVFDTISPLDYRYVKGNALEKIKPYLSESAFIKYVLRVESALAKTLAEWKICNNKIAKEIEKATLKVTAEEVYEEESKIKHNIRALANCIRNKVSNKAKPFVHFTATSYDIIATADAARYKDFANSILLPELIKLEKTLIEIALREKNTVQIGRTHGQFASPLTFGFAIAHYISRVGSRIIAIKKSANNLRGKIAGAVGAYNASYLFINKVEEFEEDVLKKIGLMQSPTSTQIVEPEFFVDFLSNIVSCFGVLANLADDMRHLQRSEIAEVGEAFGIEQVGSSTMPQKRNPINFENIKSMWKEFMPRIMTMYMDQISEHQRDLTNSASMRFVPELLAGFYVSVIRINKVMSKLVVDKENIKRNFENGKDMIIAEPLYIILAGLGHPDAHEYVRQKTLEAQQKNKALIEVIKKDKSMQQYFKKINKKQLGILNNPEKYTGIAVEKTEKVCGFWRKELGI